MLDSHFQKYFSLLGKSWVKKMIPIDGSTLVILCKTWNKNTFIYFKNILRNKFKNVNLAFAQK